MESKAVSNIAIQPNCTDFLIIKSSTTEDLKINFLYLLKQIYNLKWFILLIIPISLLTGVYFSSHLKPQYVTNISLTKADDYLYLYPNVYNSLNKNDKNSYSDTELKMFLLFKFELKNAQNIDDFFKGNLLDKKLNNTILVQEKPDGYINLSLTLENQEMSKSALLEYVDLINKKTLMGYINKQKRIGMNLIKIKSDQIKHLSIISPIKNANKINLLKFEKANLKKFLENQLTIDRVNCYTFAQPIETKVITRKATKNLIVFISLLVGLSLSFVLILFKSNIAEFKIQELFKST